MNPIDLAEAGWLPDIAIRYGRPTDPRYRTLLVRVWGFSTVFVSLDPDLQQHVIERTEHEL